MAYQVSTRVRNAMLDSIESTTGVSAILKIRTGAQPANPAAADSGTVVATANLPADWRANAAAGVKSLSGTWQDASADATGTAGHFRIYDSGGVNCDQQGSVGQATIIATSALTAANGNVLTFTATTGVAVGMNVSGTGIPANTTVIATTGTTVTLSNSSTSGVASSTSITFSYDMTVDNASFVLGQTFNVTAFSLTAPNA